MSPDAQRIAIAEACGWADIRRPCDDSYHDLPTDTLGLIVGRVCGLPPGYIHAENVRPLPDYLNDLNAMHEAEKALLRIVAQQHYATSLYRVMAEPDRHLDVIYRATAAQRAEAFLRTLSLWDDTK